MRNIIGLSTVHCGTWTIILWYLSHGNTESPVANQEISIKGGGNTAYEMGAARVMRQWLPNFFRQKGLGQRAPCPINPPLVPGGTPDVTGTDLEDIPCITTVCVLSDKKVLVQLNVFFSYTRVFKLVKLYICWQNVRFSQVHNDEVSVNRDIANFDSFFLRNRVQVSDIYISLNVHACKVKH